METVYFQNSLKVVVMSKTPTGKNFVLADGEVELTENEMGEPGIKVTARSDFLNGKQVYLLDAFYQPISELKGDEKACELSFNLV